MLSIVKGIVELVRGMTITGKHLGKHAVTLQYPEEKWPMPERSRGIVVLLSDKETGELNCTACMLCMRACPTAAISIDAPRGEDKKRRLVKFEVDNTICCFCGLCEEACNFAAIKMAPKYEFSTENKEDLVWDMHKLQEMGRDVPYEPRPKKKPAPKPTPPKPEAGNSGSDTRPVEPPKPSAPVNPGAAEAGPEASEEKTDDTKEGEA
ncbi:MAG: NADH-quinone oxidoreductase subunit I [Candidatus Zixiibacteriota bacterium]|nr:MAG: NADH-quinone oxidoreductase subunit I [candidate division Zixibacteria bacterium]